MIPRYLNVMRYPVVSIRKEVSYLNSHNTINTNIHYSGVHLTRLK